MADFSTVRRLTATWPDVTEGTSYGTPALRVKKQLLCRLWGERELARTAVRGEVLVLACAEPVKAALVAEGGPFFTTPHYDGHEWVLVRLADISVRELRPLLEDAYRLRAPTK